MPNGLLPHDWQSHISFTSFRVLAAVSIFVARDACAQSNWALDLFSQSGRTAEDTWQSRIALSPFARFDKPRVTLDGRWTAIGGNGAGLRGFGSLEGTWFSPTRAGLQFSLAGFADRSLLAESFAVTRAGADARLSYRAGASGAWLGRMVSRDNQSTPVSPVPRISAGGWRQWGGAVLTFSLSSFASRERGGLGAPQRPTGPFQNGSGGRSAPDTLLTSPPRNGLDTATTTPQPIDTGTTTTRRNWNDAEVALHWSAGRLAFRGIVGTRFSATRQPNEMWGQIEGTVALAPDVAFIASSGVHPSSAAYGLPRAQFVQMGFRIAPSALLRPRLPTGVRPVAAAFEVRRADRGQRTVTIRVPNARTVELSGDFTDWKPVTLTRSEADRWEVTLTIAPGMHRVAIRVDGDAWTVPPGVSAVPDEFQGTVGVIVLPN